jgi:flavin reductase (NADH)
METTDLIQDFKTALSHWASGVTVIAAEANGERRGMTASSFSSVSLNPPLVLVCVDHKANTLEFLEQAGSFVVNILAEGQEQESIHFSGRPAPDHQPLNPDLSIDGAIATLYCQKWAVYPGGDHQIVVGLVEKVGMGEGPKPLVYWNRGYRSIG